MSDELVGEEATSPGLYQAGIQLSADAAFQIPSNLNFKSGECIELLPGFQVGSSVNFSAEIEGCGQ